MNGEWCPGSNQPHCGDACYDCGRKYNQGRLIVDPQSGMARRHMPLSFNDRRRKGLVPSQKGKK